MNDLVAKKTLTFSDDQERVELDSLNVEIEIRKAEHDHGSSKLRLKNIVDYKWEQRFYPGRLIAVHTGGKIIAYAMKVTSRLKADARTEGMVRVVCTETGQRGLIKGQYGEILDLQFAFIKDPIYLAFIESNKLHVQKIVETKEKLEYMPILQLEHPAAAHVPLCDKVAWCPYVPETSLDKDTYASRLVVWARGDTFHCFNVDDVRFKCGVGPHTAEAIKESGYVANQLTTSITDVTYSPDGTTLAVSSMDGKIRFYQIYLFAAEDTPRCLHEWEPHGGRQVSSFYFLDNITQFTPDGALWRYALTCCAENTEVKLWCCKTWKCIQKIKFSGDGLAFKTALDPTASYFVLSDMNNRMLYVLQVVTSADMRDFMLALDDSKESKRSSDFVSDPNFRAYVKSVARFPLSSPILSFSVADAAVRRYKCGLSDAYLIEELEDYDEENNSLYCVALHMFLVQPKSVQECHVFYQPTLPTTADVYSTISDHSLGILDEPEKSLSTLKAESSAEMAAAVAAAAVAVTAAQKPSPFPPTPPAETLLIDFGSRNPSEAKVVASVGSSPSREVQEILSTSEKDDDDGVFKYSSADYDDGVRLSSKALLKDEVMHPDTPPIKAELAMLAKKLEKMLEIQHEEMESLRVEIRKLQTASNIPTAAQERSLEKTLFAHVQSEEKMLETLQRRREKQEQEFYDRFFATLAQSFTQLPDKVALETAAKLQLQFVPAATAQLNAAFQKICVRNIQALDTSPIADALSKSLGVEIQQRLQLIFKDAVQTSLIPAYERISRELLAQLNGVFTAGARDYVKSFEDYASHSKSADVVAHRQLEEQMKRLPDTARLATEAALKSLNTQVSDQLSKNMKLLQTQLAKTVREQVRVEVQKCFEEQASSLHDSVLTAVRSQTPAPGVFDVQESVRMLLMQRQTNKAFHTALLANDLSLLEFALEKADFAAVFQPCCLNQEVLLSLIQHISADMKNFNELKSRYLSAALVSLDAGDSVTREHAPKILRELSTNIGVYLRDNPVSPLAMGLRMLEFAIKNQIQTYTSK